MGFGNEPPRSFGRRDEPKDQAPVVVVPPLQLTQIQVPVALVLDPEALRAMADQIQQMIRRAVLGGFDEAMAQVESNAETSFADVGTGVDADGADAAGPDAPKLSSDYL